MNTPCISEPVYVYDPTVDAELDLVLRTLLSSCFSDKTFVRQRFNFELPAHRWLMRDAHGLLVAHAAVHDKRIGSEAGDLRVGAVAEVCVHPLHRRRGYVRSLLEAAHGWMRAEAMPFSILLGLTGVYRGLGYEPADNPVRHYRVSQRCWVIEPMDCFQVLKLADTAWPQGTIDLRGPTF